MKKIKSQITMLMIIGLVIFITISLVLYLYKSTIKKYGQQSIKKSHESSLDSQPIRELAAKCVDKLAKDAIILLSRQGGYIYASQGGTSVDFNDAGEGVFFVNYNGHKVAYNILPPIFGLPVPIYPWEAFPYETALSNKEVFDGYFGINNMPPLHSYEGPHSIKTQIETFVNNKISGCINLSLFESQGYEIEMPNSQTKVTIGITDVIIDYMAPLRITNTITKETFEVKDLSTKLDVRLWDIYAFASRLIGYDTENIKFDIGDPKNNKDFLNIAVRKDIISNDDLIIITDKKSLIYGKPLEYIFARKNRAPALYYIRPNTLTFPSGYLINETDLLQDSPKAEDPDEDNYEFKIFMWESGNTKAQFPVTLNQYQIIFRVEVNDGSVSDNQIITVFRI